MQKYALLRNLLCLCLMCQPQSRDQSLHFPSLKCEHLMKVDLAHPYSGQKGLIISMRKSWTIFPCSPHVLGIPKSNLETQKSNNIDRFDLVKNPSNNIWTSFLFCNLRTFQPSPKSSSMGPDIKISQIPHSITTSDPQKEIMLLNNKSIIYATICMIITLLF